MFDNNAKNYKPVKVLKKTKLTKINEIRSQLARCLTNNFSIERIH